MANEIRPTPRSPGPGRALGHLFLVAFAGAAAAQGQSAAAKGTPAVAATIPVPVEVARVGFVEGGVEIQRAGGAWTKAVEDEPLSSGDRVRTLRGGTARLEFPWTAVALGDGSEVTLEKKRLLTLRLESGRIDIDPEQALLRVVTPEAAISGSGRTLVRREGTTTFIGSYFGGANVESASASAKSAVVRLGVNKGVIVNGGGVLSDAMPMAASPRVVSPGANLQYVRPGEAIRLTWTGREPAYHLEVLSIDNDVPVVSLDLDPREFDLRLNWLGTFRWRVSGRTGPVETQASGEGLICVVDK